MSKIHGTKAKALPTSLLDGLHSLGYLPLNTPPADAPLFRHPKHRELFVTAVTTNMPGEDAVMAKWSGVQVQRIAVDALLAQLEEQLTTAASPNRVMFK